MRSILYFFELIGFMTYCNVQNSLTNLKSMYLVLGLGRYTGNKYGKDDSRPIKHHFNKQTKKSNKASS